MVPAATKQFLSCIGEACSYTRFRDLAAGRARQVRAVFIALLHASAATKQFFPAPAKRVYTRDSAISPRAAPAKYARFLSRRRAPPPRSSSFFPAPAKRVYTRDSATSPRAAPAKCARFLSRCCTPPPRPSSSFQHQRSVFIHAIPRSRRGPRPPSTRGFYRVAVRLRRDQAVSFQHRRSVFIHAIPRPRRGPRPLLPPLRARIRKASFPVRRLR